MAHQKTAFPSYPCSRRGAKRHVLPNEISKYRKFPVHAIHEERRVFLFSFPFFFSRHVFIFTSRLAENSAREALNK